MMMSLFSIFDPCSKWSFFSSWYVFMFILILFPNFFFSNPSNKINNLLFFYLNKDTNLNKTFNFTFLSVFMFILLLNFIGLFPYILAASSHISVSFSLSLTMWLSVMIYSLVNRMEELLSHLVPLGCPSNLMFFMVVIESVSILIRPVTLAVRLSANIMAGHVILALISSVSFFNSVTFISSIMSQLVLFVLETAVAVVQPYVFFTLLCLYKQDAS